MVIEQPLLPFLEWFRACLPVFAIWILAITVVGLLLGFLVAAVRTSPVVAARRVGRAVIDGIREFREISFRRIWALARLSIKESIRRNVLVIFAIFAVILLFASWYLDADSDNPARLYLSFVLKSTNFLLTLLAVFLSAFSLPTDIRNKTIFTVVTKPVRPWEIIFGRVVGFMLVCSVFLVLMCLSSYVFVRRGIAHTHQIDAATVEVVDGEVGGQTDIRSFHRHEFTARHGGGETDARHGHFHHVEINADDSSKGTVGPPEGALLARVPIYGELRFLDRKGEPTDKGINVGKEWAYRGYIDGGTLSAAIFKFRGIQSRDFPDGLPLEMTIRVFRTYVGKIERGILGSIMLRNPNPALHGGEGDVDNDTAIESEEIPITATDSTAFKMTIPRRINSRMASDKLYREVDLYESLVHNGEIELVLRCAERDQYFGVAMTDLYIRSADKLFWTNFVKSFVTMWLQLLVVISFGVMFSTFLTGAVAMLATIGSFAMGYFSKTIVDLTSGKLEGGGPGEAAIRLLSQKNLVDEFAPSIPLLVVKWIDAFVLMMMKGVSYMMPNFRDYAEYGGMNTARFVAYGFDIPSNLMGQHAVVAFAYAMVTASVAYYFLKTKEIAA